MSIQRAKLLRSVCAALLVAACAGGDEAADHAEETAVSVAMPDTTGASMWSYLQEVDYQEHWDLWPDKGALYAGQQPHGMLLTTYLNDVAMQALRDQTGTMPAGAIVVKENYRPDSTLAAVTTMYKVPGYNADHNDWFFTKHLANGDLDRVPEGMPMAGMAMEGRLGGCQSCHTSVRANDYLFTGALSSGGG
jgi:hypothetical protein